MNNAVFGKNIKNWRIHRDIKLVTTERRRNCLVSEPNYHTTKIFTENLLAVEIKTKAKTKKEIFLNKPANLRLRILELIKTLMDDFWYDYLKPKYV